jgi:hypothetical protein
MWLKTLPNVKIKLGFLYLVVIMKKTMQGILEDRMSTPAEVSFSGMSPTGCYALQSML